MDLSDFTIPGVFAQTFVNTDNDYRVTLYPEGYPPIMVSVNPENTAQCEKVAAFMRAVLTAMLDQQEGGSA